ncbi:cilia- and flagella-associated protein 44 isoform X2 [Maniola jurtina]|uniref:cilia- and flagella-associated protein 44 isoform X2 n=1 Tax=Maniola jurtina TaxID=191418 RepID=UPI001E68760D|nr:cilia- and flagella-associated protein 44 isoform X2 [Maniola jurtina]
MADEEVPGEGGEEEQVPEEADAEEAAEQESVEEESQLTEYDPDDFVSGAVNSLDSTIPLDLFEFEFSYGYNCNKYFNLCACDDAVVCWAAGSIITFLDVNTKQLWFRRSTTGGSVGAVSSYRRDPNYRIVIAEGREGERDPIILLYTWPQMEIDAVLRDGTTNAYSVLDFSPDGELLASVGREPDYNLTIWNWKRHTILLRTSAFTFDVNTVMFSPYCPGQLTTAGAAHIKMWKMSNTFTGLKLKGELGRFGKTEICDVLGVYPMPDEKVLSGCEWGNVLVWEAGLVKLEVTQRGRKTCHKAPIIQFMLSLAGDEVTTIGRDGYVRAWYWDTVEQADPPEDDPYVELNPVAETYVPGCQIMCLKHQKDMYWYAQDGNGGVWTVELDIDKLECNHRKVMTFHSGGVVAIAALRTHPILITAGEDGALHAYNTETHILLARYQFQAAVTCLLYPPIDVDATSRVILVGFADGIMRMLLVHPERLQAHSSLIEIKVHSALTIHSEDSVNADVLDLISLLKPHSKAITQITINEPRTLLVTCGEDCTIFMYHLELGTPFTLERLGFIQTPNNVAYMTWKPNEERVLLLCGQLGVITEAELPDIPVQKYTEITTFKQKFVSYEEILVKKYYLRHRPFPTEEDLASIDEEALKAQGEAEKDKDDEEDVWVGEIQLEEEENMPGTTITWAEYCEEGIWVVQQGTGALLLVKPKHTKIIKYGPFPGAWREDATVLKFVCERRYLVVGTNTGYIRVFRMPTEEEDSPDRHYMTWMMAQQKLLKKLKGRRLAKEEKQPTPRIDFDDNYYLPMHDRYTGALTCLELTSDGTHFYTCASDGNIFSYVINFTEPLITRPEIPGLEELPKVEKVKEPSTVDGELMSHEQLKQKEEYDKMISIANAHKKRVRDQLAELTIEYTKLIKANRLLPFSQQIDVTLDPRPLIVQEKELDDMKALTRRKLAHQLEASDLGLHKMYARNIVQLDVFPFTLKAIRDPEIMIRPLRQKNLSKAFYDQLEEVHQKMAEASLRGRRAESTTLKAAAKRASWGPPRVASFLLGLPPNPPHPLKKALRNYYQRINRHHIQFIEWQEHLSRKPDPHAMPPGAAEALKEAEDTIGNRVLKTEADYVAPHGHNTQLRLCLTRKEIYDNKRAFNEKVLKLREQKVGLVSKMQDIGRRLGEIRVEIPHKLAKPPPAVPHIDDDLEFPEKNLEIKPKVVLPPGQRKQTIRKSEERRKSTLYPQQRARQPRVPLFVPITESRPLSASWDILKSKPDQESSAIEIEIRERRIERHLYEQDMLIVNAEMLVRNFDSRLQQLQRERIRVQETNQLLELHLYQLHREMTVLNRFEAHEDRLAERVYAKLMQVRAVNDQINDCNQRIEEHKAEKERLDLTCQELQRQFKKLVQDNKFADFLRRIFKKKYRPPRDHDDDESSESESSSSSSEEDEGSLDSRDIGPIRLDPNICPEGCDVDIYNKTYELRNTRHKHEQEMIEQDRLVELLRKDIEAHNKVKRKFSVQLEKRKQDLREFMMEKQSCMNEVDQVVILRYDQIRASALRGCTGPGGLSDTVVFPEKMLSKLRRRVLELQDEIKQQKQRQKVNRTHLFRMNVDLRAMENRAAEMSAQMRDVLTRKLGKPRKVDRTLDELIRQLAKRHKFTATLASVPHLLSQLRTWRERYSQLEQKYLTALNRYSDRLRLAAALQADVYPQKPTKDPSKMAGGYEPEQYRRDVVRLRIIRSQQEQQIKALEEEIQGLRLKPLSHVVSPPQWSPPESDRSQVYLHMVRPSPKPSRQKYFPITPLGSHVKLVYEVNLMKLLYDCLDMMRVSRDEADVLLQELTNELPKVISGEKTRYEVVDSLVRKWLLKYGGDPSLYKKQTRAFDALAALADRLIKQHIQEMEGLDSKEHEVMQSLETALKDVAGVQPLRERLGPALATLLHTTQSAELEGVETTTMTMTSLVNSLINEEHPLTAESIDAIEVFDVVEDLKDCGVNAPAEELENVVKLAIDCLRAQLVSPEEKLRLDKDIEEALQVTSLATTQGSSKSDLGDKTSKEQEK